MATEPRQRPLEGQEVERTRRSGPPIGPLYGPEVAPPDPEETVGRPGEYPFTRGPYESMYRGRLWTMRQFAGFGTVEETNERFHYLLDHGQTGLSTAFDMPTLMGYDSDHERSLGEVGREGVAVDSLDDMEQLFDGIPLRGATTSMTINSPASTSTTSSVGSPSSSTPPSTSSRRSRSTGGRAGSGRARCATPTAPSARSRCGCASTRRPPASR